MFMHVNKTLKLESNPYYYRIRQGSAMHGGKKHPWMGSMLNLARKYHTLLISDQARALSSDLKSEMRQRESMCVAALLFDAARDNSLDRVELLKMLKKEGLYPYKPLFFTLRYSTSLKHTLIEYSKFLFPCRIYYLAFSRIMGVVNNG